MRGSEGAPALTVVLPAYIPRGEAGSASLELLTRAIASLTEQSDPRWVCRVYDNSPDKSLVAGLVRGLQDERFHHCPNVGDVGLLGSMNRGLSEAETELVGFLHGDDQLARDYASRVVTVLTERPDMVGLLSAVEVVDADGLSIHPLADRIKRTFAPSKRRAVVLEGDRSAARLMFAMWAYSPSLVIRRHLVGDLRFDETNLYAGDTEFIVDLLVSGGRLFYVPEPLYRYRRHGESGTVVMTKDGTRARMEREFFTRKASELEGRGFPRSAVAARMRPFSRLASLGVVGRRAAARSYQ